MAIKEIELPTLHCERCGWNWIPRTPRPKWCPRCKSDIWFKKKDRRRKDRRWREYKQRDITTEIKENLEYDDPNIIPQ